MKEMYNNYEEEDDDWDLPEVSILSMTHIRFCRKLDQQKRATDIFLYLYIFQEKDPFQEDLNQEITIGTVQVFLQPIAYMVSHNINSYHI